MTATYNGKKLVVNKSATKPTGKPAQQPVKKIESAATKAKATGGSASIGGNIGNVN